METEEVEALSMLDTLGVSALVREVGLREVTPDDATGTVVLPLELRSGVFTVLGVIEEWAEFCNG